MKTQGSQYSFYQEKQVNQINQTIEQKINNYQIDQQNHNIQKNYQSLNQRYIQNLFQTDEIHKKLQTQDNEPQNKREIIKRKKSVQMLVYRTSNVQNDQKILQKSPKKQKKQKIIQQKIKMQNKHSQLKLYDYLQEILMVEKNNIHRKKQYQLQNNLLNTSKNSSKVNPYQNNQKQIPFVPFGSDYQAKSERILPVSKKNCQFFNQTDYLQYFNRPASQSFNQSHVNSNTNRYQANSSNQSSFIKKKQRNFTIIEKLSPSPLKEKVNEQISNRRNSKSNGKAKSKITVNNVKYNKSPLANSKNNVNLVNSKQRKSSTIAINKENVIPVTRQTIYRMNQQMMNKQMKDILNSQPSPQENDLLFKKINVNNNKQQQQYLNYINKNKNQNKIKIQSNNKITQNDGNKNKTNKFLQQFRKTFNQCLGVIKTNKKYSTNEMMRKSKIQPHQNKQNNQSKQQITNFFSQKGLSDNYQKSPEFNQYKNSQNKQFYNGHRFSKNNQTQQKQEISMIRLTTDQQLDSSDSYQIKNSQRNTNNIISNSVKQENQLKQFYTTFGKEQLHDQYQQSPGIEKIEQKSNIFRSLQASVSRKGSKNSIQSNKNKIQYKVSNKKQINNSSHINNKPNNSNLNQNFISQNKLNNQNVNQKKFKNISNSNQQYLINNLIKDLAYDMNKFLVGHKKLQVKYDGQKKDNIRSGHGTLYYFNGLGYEGQFKNNVREGYGILKFNHIQLYSGDWFNDQLSGQGKIRNCAIINKKKSSNNNLNQTFTSFGMNVNSPLHKWISYCGQFRANRFQGQGTLYLQGGQKFIGHFENGAANGQGSLIKKNGQIQAGIWKNGILIQKYQDQHFLQ